MKVHEAIAHMSVDPGVNKVRHSTWEDAQYIIITAEGEYQTEEGEVFTMDRMSPEDDPNGWEVFGDSVRREQEARADAVLTNFVTMTRKLKDKLVKTGFTEPEAYGLVQQWDVLAIFKALGDFVHDER